MEEDECLICGDAVCDPDLLESMNLSSVADLPKAFAKLFPPGPFSVNFESEFNNAPLCYKCISRVLDAHNLVNQLKLLEIKLKAIQFDVLSEMKKIESRENRNLSKQKKQLAPHSKFQQLRKDIINSSGRPIHKEVLESDCKDSALDRSSCSNQGKSSEEPSSHGKSAKRKSNQLTPVKRRKSFSSTHNNGSDDPQDSSQDEVVAVERPAGSSMRLRPRASTSKYMNAAANSSSSMKNSTRTEEIFSDTSEDESFHPTNEEEPQADANKDAEESFADQSNMVTTNSTSMTYDASVDPLIGKLRCPYERCNTVYFATDYSRQAHIKKIHEGIKKPFECETCGRTFKYPTFLKAHSLSHAGENNFPCQSCGKVLRSVKSLQVHEKTHRDGGKPFSCEQCEKSFANRHHLDTHKISHEKNTTFCCNVCKKSFLRKRSLELHTKVHDNPELGRCTICDKMFSNNHSLRVHEQEFHNERVEKLKLCTICPFQCTLRRDMRKHQAQEHNEKRIHQCECGKNLSSRKALKLHMRTHSTDLLFQCSICQKQFKYDNARKRHENLHYNLVFVCEVCGKSFADRTYLNTHLRLHEPKGTSSLTRHGETAYPVSLTRVVQLQQEDTIVETETDEAEVSEEESESNEIAGPQQFQGRTIYEIQETTSDASPKKFAEIVSPARVETHVVEIVATLAIDDQ